MTGLDYLMIILGATIIVAVLWEALGYLINPDRRPPKRFK